MNVNMFAKAVIREQRLPFEVVADPFYNESNQKALRKSIEQSSKGKAVYKTMEELEAME